MGFYKEYSTPEIPERLTVACSTSRYLLQKKRKRRMAVGFIALAKA